VRRLKPCWRKRAIALSLLAASTALTVSSVVHAQLYEYRDESGRRVFVDRLYKVPPEYRDQLIERKRSVQTPEQQLETARLQQVAELETAVRRIDQLLERVSSPISFSNNQIVVPVQVSRGNRSRDLKLLLDTGANRTVFHRHTLTDLAIQEREVGAARTASGEAIPLYQASLDKLQIGPFEISPAQVQMLDFSGSSPHQGLLGMDLLSQVKYELDLEAQELHWAPEQVAQLRLERDKLLNQIESLRSQQQPEPERAPSATSADDRAQ